VELIEQALLQALSSEVNPNTSRFFPPAAVMPVSTASAMSH
jgi:hypothetical protein